jgi:hypothetical protein
MAAGLVLDPAAHLVNTAGGELDDMKWVGDLGGFGEHRVEHVAIRAGQIEGRPADPIPPRLGAFREPCTRRCSAATSGNVEELASCDVDDLGRPRLCPPSAFPAEQRLVEADRVDVPVAVRVVDQRCPEVHDGVHDRVPITRQVMGDLGHRATVSADLDRRPPPGTIGDRRTSWGDPLVDLAPRSDLARRIGTRSTNATSTRP